MGKGDGGWMGRNLGKVCFSRRKECGGSDVKGQRSMEFW